MVYRPVAACLLLSLGAIAGCSSKPPQSASQADGQKMALRQMHVGDAWEYNVYGDGHGGTLSVSVVSEKPAANGGRELLCQYVRRYYVRASKAYNTPGHWKIISRSHGYSQFPDGSLVWLGPQDGDQEGLGSFSASSLFLPGLRSPLIVGQKIDVPTSSLINEANGRTETGGYSYQVAVFEPVSLPSGTVSAFRVDITRTLQGPKEVITTRWQEWYTSDSLLVKREQRNTVKFFGYKTHLSKQIELAKFPPGKP
jgi:hypothetical protein